MITYRIAFLHDGPHGFTPRTAEICPIGGTQAAAGYLAAALAGLGQHVWLLSHIERACSEDGVACLPIKKLSGELLASLDVIILVQSVEPGLLLSLRQLVAADCRIFLWTGQAHDQPALAALSDQAIHHQLDGIWGVSAWQCAGLSASFAIPPEHMIVVRNAVAPSFEAYAREVRTASLSPQQVFYSSTPFRGLELLLDIFAAFPVSPFTLNIFGGMVQYHQDDGPWHDLYARAQAMAGCHVHGALAHPALAAALSTQDLWLYPSIFAETSCINALEALAVGALPLVSTLGALPETLGEMAIYVPWHDDYEQLKHDFVMSLQHVLEIWPDIDHNVRIAAQKAWVLKHATWSSRAEEIILRLASK